MSSQRPKEFRFPVHVGWTGGRRVQATVAGKASLPIAPPPVFRGTDPDMWSPEDAFVAAAASCLAVTITGLAQREGLPLRSLDVDSEGIVGQRPDGRFGFVRIVEHVRVGTDPGCEETARALVSKAEDSCLVAVSLDLPVESEVVVQAITSEVIDSARDVAESDGHEQHERIRQPRPPAARLRRPESRRRA